MSMREPAAFNMPEIRLADGHRGFLVCTIANPTNPAFQNAIVLVPGRPRKPMELALPIGVADLRAAQNNAKQFREMGPALQNRGALGLINPDGTPLA